MRTKEILKILKILKQNGFEIVSQNGSHIKLYNDNVKRTVIVPNHTGDIKIGTLNSILKQVGLK